MTFPSGAYTFYANGFPLTLFFDSDNLTSGKINGDDLTAGCRERHCLTDHGAGGSGERHRARTRGRGCRRGCWRWRNVDEIHFRGLAAAQTYRGKDEIPRYSGGPR